MRLLAFDTSSEVLSIALYNDGKRSAGFESSGFIRHSSTLVPKIETVLKTGGIRADKLSVIAVGLGPGSFTGLRVGVTVAKTLAYALGAKLIGVSSLEALACAMDADERPVVAVMDARRGKFYAGIYKRTRAGLSVLKKPFLAEPRDMDPYRSEKFRWTGDGAAQKDAAVHPSADRIAERALFWVKKGKFADPLKLVPLYLYPKECNVTLPRKK